MRVGIGMRRQTYQQTNSSMLLNKVNFMDTREDQHKEAMAKAEKLIMAIAEGKVTPELHKRLGEWLLRAPENGTAERSLADWAARNVLPSGSIPGPKEKESFRRILKTLGLLRTTPRKNVFNALSPLRWYAFRAAAVVAILVAVTAVLVTQKENIMPRETFIYADGETSHEEFSLPDGSTVILEHGSMIAYSSNFASKRTVKLDGKAFFDIVGDADHPFSVRNDGMRVIVLGTRFEVKARHNTSEAEIVLVSGKVAVEAKGNRTELSPGQKMTFDKSTGMVTRVDYVGRGEAMKISHSNFRIDNMHVMDAMTVIADYFDRELIVDENLRTGEHLNIELPADASLETVVECLNMLLVDAECHISGRAVVITRRQK
jgi:ferric-dicitrate binding protein FerR (iron transport regulator)